MRTIRILASRTLLVLSLVRSICFSESQQNLRRENKRETDYNADGRKTTTARKDETTIGPKRVWVHYGAGQHDGIVQSFRNRIQTLSIDFDFPDTDSVVIRATETELQQLREDPGVWLIEEDVKRSPLTLLLNKRNLSSNQDDIRRQRRVQFGSQMFPYGTSLVQADLAWQAGVYGQGVTVCFIDSGLDVTHPDYNEGVTRNFTGDTLVTGTSWDTDGIGHGTHITGIVKAANNSIGVVGIAPQATVHVVKVFPDNSGEIYSSDLIDAAYKCRDAGARIISMSLGGPYPLVSEADIFRQFASNGILTIAAAGNDGNKDYSYPASYDGVMSVGAIDKDKQYAYFSNSNDRVDLVAPGVEVWSTLPANGNCEICLALGINQGYASLDGTSQAAPHVAGVAALLWSRFPAASLDDIQNALLDAAEDLGSPGRDDDHGHGLVRAMTALQILNGGPLAGAPLVSEDGDVCDASEILIKVQLKTDLYGNETFWKVSRDVDNFTVLSGAGLDGLKEYTVSRCLPANCYSFSIFDSSGDGICCQYGNGTYTVTVSQALAFNSVLPGLDLGLSANSQSTLFSPESLAVPYNKVFSGGIFNDSESISLGGECEPIPKNPKPNQSICENATLTLVTDSYPEETSVRLVDTTSGIVYWNDTPLTNPASTYQFSHCLLVTRCYRFEIQDAFNDGICCLYGNGSFDLVYRGETVASGSNFGSSAVYEIGSCN